MPVLAAGFNVCWGCTGIPGRFTGNDTDRTLLVPLPPPAAPPVPGETNTEFEHVTGVGTDDALLELLLRFALDDGASRFALVLEATFLTAGTGVAFGVCGGTVDEGDGQRGEDEVLFVGLPKVRGTGGHVANSGTGRDTGRGGGCGAGEQAVFAWDAGAAVLHFAVTLSLHVKLYGSLGSEGSGTGGNLDSTHSFLIGGGCEGLSPKAALKAVLVASNLLSQT